MRRGIILLLSTAAALALSVSPVTERAAEAHGNISLCGPWTRILNAGVVGVDARECLQTGSGHAHARAEMRCTANGILVADCRFEISYHKLIRNGVTVRNEREHSGSAAVSSWAVSTTEYLDSGTCSRIWEAKAQEPNIRIVSTGGLYNGINFSSFSGDAC